MENNSSAVPPSVPPPETPASGPPPVFQPPSPPPLITPPPAQTPKRGVGRGWRILSIILSVVLGLVLLFNFISVFIGASFSEAAGPHLMEAVVENNRTDHKIALIPVEGIIMSGSDGSGYDLPQLIAAELKRAGKDDDVKAVILKVNSPGGEVLAADDIAREIEKFQKEHKKPVVAYMGSLAASGGYYVSAPCRWIVANEVTITGSIGVIMHGYNYRGLMNKVGVKPEVYKSGRFKDMLSGDRDLSSMTAEEKETYDLERKMVQSLIEETYDKFKSVVKKGREAAGQANKDQGRKLVDDWTSYADGRVLSGKQAHELGFVDELGAFEDAVKRAKKLADIEKANIVTYQIPFDLGNLFRLFGKTEARTVKVDLGLNLPNLPTGRLYFLSPILPF
jgi:protease IV